MMRYAAVWALAVSCVSSACARDNYDCADNVGIPMDARWSPSNPQIMQLIGDFYPTFKLKEKFSLDMCGVWEDGKQVFLVDALHDDSKETCGDELNFAVLYDPQTRKFSDVVPHQKLCGDKPAQ